jgi:hypothetical protein
MNILKLLAVAAMSIAMIAPARAADSVPVSKPTGTEMAAIFSFTMVEILRSEIIRLAIMKRLLLAATLALAAIAPASLMAPAKAETQTRSFYNGNGSFAGSSVTRGSSTSVYDRNGRFDGSVIRNSNGTTSVYDKSGHFTGSSTNTTQPR